MPFLGNSFTRSRRRRERLVIAATAILVVLALFFGPKVVSRMRARTEGVASRAFGGVDTVGEAASILEILGEDASDERLIAAIQDPDMPGRRLAIEFLGEGGYGDSLPVLEKIVRDRGELTDHRVAALEATYLIARHRARDLALEFRSDPRLGETCRIVLEDEMQIRQRPSRVKILLNFVQ